MPRRQDLAEVSNGVRCGEERAVEPATPLADELWQGFGDVRLCDRALDVLEHPVGIAFRDKLEAQDTLELTLANASMSSSDSLTSSARSEEPRNSVSVQNDFTADLHMFEVKMSVSRP